MSDPKTKPYAKKPFKPLNTKWLSIIIGLAGGLLVVDIITSLVMIYFYGQVSETLLMDEQAFELWQTQTAMMETVVSGFGILLAVVFVVSMVLVGKWIYDSQHNARALGVLGFNIPLRWRLGRFLFRLLGCFCPLSQCNKWSMAVLKKRINLLFIR
ncbi:MAG: hypothetical protein Q4B88_00185 [Moraxella sp.]|nr:hypothetical protein [Moraxella sp.]